MKKIYENFKEIADDFSDGNHWTHKLSDHDTDDCFAWQHGIFEFAKFLDTCGMRIVSNPEIYDTMWEDFKNYKPDKYKDHVKADVLREF